MKKRIARFAPSLSAEDIREIFKIILMSKGIEGRGVREFEKGFAHYIGTKFAVSVPSARIGLYLILKDLNLSKGDEIILPAFTYHIVPSIIISLGLRPVFADIYPQTYNIDIPSVKERISKKTKAIIPTHLYGLPCDMDSILDLAKENRLIVIEDCAQACGAEYKGRKVGSLGDYAYFTFGLTKNFTTLNGGMITTNNERVASEIDREVSSYKLPTMITLVKMAIMAILMERFTRGYLFGITLYPLIRISDLFDKDPLHDIFDERKRLFKDIPEDYMRRMSNLQAEVGLRQLRSLDFLNQKRIENASFLIEHLKGNRGIQVPIIPPGTRHIFASFVIQTNEREGLAKRLLRKGIDTSKGYVKNCADMDIFREFQTSCPNAQKIEDNMLHIPVYPSLDEDDIRFIGEVLNYDINPNPSTLASDEVVKHYSSLSNDYADFYLKEYPAWHHISKRRIDETLKILPPVSGKKVLDVGCGPGYFANELGKLGGDVLGIDGAEGMIEASRRLITSDKVKIRLMDIHKLDIADSQFDIIICLNVFRLLRNPSKALSEMYRVLKKGGILILEIHNKLSLGGQLIKLLKVLCRGKKERLQRLNIDVGPVDRYYTLSEIKGLLSRTGFEYKGHTNFLFTSPQMSGKILSLFQRIEKVLESTPLRYQGGLILLKCVKG